MHIRRLLELVEKYVSIIEETHPAPRSILPHGLAFKGEPIGLHIRTEDSKTDIDLLVNRTLVLKLTSIILFLFNNTFN